MRICLVLRFVALRDSSEEKEEETRLNLRRCKRDEGCRSVYEEMLEKDKH